MSGCSGKRSRADGVRRTFSDNRIRPYGGGGHTKRLQNKRGVTPPMSDRVGAGGVRENIAYPHFVTPTKRQICRSLPRGRMDIGSRVMLQLLPRAEVGRRLKPGSA